MSLGIIASALPKWYCHILTTLSFVCFLSAQACFQKTPLDFLPQSRIVWKNGSSVVRHSHARQTVGTRITLPTTERLAWQCGDHTVKLESAVCRRFHVTKICCFSVARGTARAVVLARSPPLHTEDPSGGCTVCKHRSCVSSGVAASAARGVSWIPNRTRGSRPALQAFTPTLLSNGTFPQGPLLGWGGGSRFSRQCNLRGTRFDPNFRTGSRGKPSGLQWQKEHDHSSFPLWVPCVFLSS